MKNPKLLAVVANILLAVCLVQASAHAQESIDGVSTTYGWIETSDGYRLRLIETRPTASQGSLPLVYFVQWLSCDSIAINPRRNDGWTQMLRGLVTGGPYMVARVDKAGVGDSGGPSCSELDYNTELRHHAEALAQLVDRSDIRSDSVILFGASMGATMAPLLAANHEVKGVAVWGGGTVTWLERLLAFDRHALELGDTPPAGIAATISRNAAFYQRYLIDQETPRQIIAGNPAMKAVADGIIGLSESDHYGRPFAFHHQAQQQNWQGAWNEVDASVLILFGEFDWFETASSHRSILKTINRRRPGQARMEVIPDMDHHFSIFPNAVSAFEDTAGTPSAEPFLKMLLPWLSNVIDE